MVCPLQAESVTQSAGTTQSSIPAIGVSEPFKKRSNFHSALAPTPHQEGVVLYRQYRSNSACQPRLATSLFSPSATHVSYLGGRRLHSTCIDLN